jgi:hypothetical protein
LKGEKMAKKIKGTVEKVSTKTSGIMISGKWYNAKGKSQELINKIGKGSEIEITLLDGTDKDVCFINILKTPGKIEKEDYQLRKEKRDIEYAKRMSRGASLNSAIEILKSKNEPVMLDDAFKMADEIRNWCER